MRKTWEIEAVKAELLKASQSASAFVELIERMNTYDVQSVDALVEAEQADTAKKPG